MRRQAGRRAADLVRLPQRRSAQRLLGLLARGLALRLQPWLPARVQRPKPHAGVLLSWRLVLLQRLQHVVWAVRLGAETDAARRQVALR